MKKDEFINDVLCSMVDFLSSEGMVKLNRVLTMKLNDIDLIENSDRQLPAETVDNENILRLYRNWLLVTNHSEQTISAYMLSLTTMLNDINKPYNMITGDMVMAWLYIRMERDGISLRSASNNQRNISAFYQWAFKKEYIPKNIMNNVDTLKPPTKAIDCLSPSEIASCKYETREYPELWALFNFMMCTGSRITDIVNMNVENVDFDKKEIRYTQHKTGNECIAFLTEDCCIALKKYLNGRTSGALFSKNGKRRSKKSIEEYAKKIGVLGNCHIKTTVHVFRKTLASLLSKKNVPVDVIQSVLGHTSLNTTQKFYIKADQDRNRAIVTSALL